MMSERQKYMNNPLASEIHFAETILPKTKTLHNASL